MSWASLGFGALGGVLVVILDVLFWRIADLRQRRKNLTELLRALYFEEIAPTRCIARRLDEDPSGIRPEVLPALRQELWSESRFRIAELAEAELFLALAKYYAYLKALRGYLEINVEQRKREEYGRPMAAKMRTQGEALAERIGPLISLEPREGEGSP